MAIERFINNFQTTLSSGIDGSTTSIPVNAATSVAAQFRAKIDNEIIIITANGNTTTWTATRGAEGTSNVSHSSGATVTVVQTAGSFEQAIADRVRTGTYANLPATSDALEGHEYITTDSIYRFRFNGTSWLAYYHDELVTLPPTSGWTWDNQESGDDVSFALGSMNFIAIRTAVGEHALQYRTAPSAPFTLDFLFEFDPSGIDATGATGGRDGNVGVYFRDSTGKLVFYGIGAFGDSVAMKVQYWTNNGTLNTDNVIVCGDNSGQLLTMGLSSNLKRLRIVDTNTNVEFYWAAFKDDWQQFGSAISRTAFLGSGPTQYGIGGYKGDSTIRMNVLSIKES